MEKFVSLLMEAPEGQLDPKMKTYIEKWSDPPTAVQLLEVLDHCIHGGLASGMVIALLQGYYRSTLDNEKTTHEEVVKNATWRSL